MAKELSRLQHSGAVLESTGLSGTAIARILDVKEATISRWHKEDHYLKAVDEYGKRADLEIAPIIARARAEVWALHETALKVIIDAMKATNKNGDPAHGTRLAAAQTLERFIRLHLLREGPQEAGGGAAASATLVIQLDGQGKIVSQTDQPPAIEGSAEDVT